MESSGRIITFEDGEFDQVSFGKDKIAWEAFKLLATKFLGNKRADNYTELVSNLIKAYRCMKCNMSLKIHFLDSHLDFFHQTVETLVMSMVSDFTNADLQWKRGTRENRINQCLLTFAG
ncbi:unnamed protein product [Clavelina lepadiformis]|uniref:Uncharacterized protein n=1 Tax=Clavelina lepadiformis TaxID=159417 RepID=A0ABP0FKY0_CLALP